jgi:GH24 family phage-related lysozyme (muramidase)
MSGFFIKQIICFTLAFSIKFIILKITTKKERNQMKKKTIFLTLLISVGIAFAYSGLHSSKKKSDSLFDDVVTAPATAPPIAPQPVIEPSNPLPAVSTTPQTSTAKTGYIKSVKSISRTVAIEQYNLTHYYESIVSEVEGFRASMYSDSVGGAIGNGWNVSMQNREMNTAITNQIGLSQADSQALIALSSNLKLKPASFPNVSITPAQATKAAQVMRIKAFEPIVIKALTKPVWDKLTPYQQAVIVYHAYKTGSLNWKNLKASIIKCANTQDKNVCADTGSQFTYSYMMNGTRMYDKRSNLYMNALFQNPADYGYLLGLNNASPDFTNIAKASTMKIDTTKKADEQIESQDDFGKVKEKMIESGQSFKLDVISPDPIPKPVVYRKPLPMGYMG